MSISNVYENKILDKVFRNVDFTINPVYVSLHTADPGETGANECVGGGYARQAAAFNVAAAGLTDNIPTVAFPNMPAGPVTHVGIWDLAASGNPVWGGPLDVPKTLNAGDTFQLDPGDLDVTLD